MPRRETALSRALQHNRDLRNKLHEIEQGHLPLRSEIAGLKIERDRIAAKVARLERRNHALRDALTAAVHLAHEFLDTGKE